MKFHWLKSWQLKLAFAWVKFVSVLLLMIKISQWACENLDSSSKKIFWLVVIVIHKTQSFRERFNKVWSNCRVQSHGSQHMQISQNLMLNATDNSSNFCYSMIQKWVAFYSIIEPKVLMFTFNSFLPGTHRFSIVFNKLTIWNQKLKMPFIHHKINLLLIDNNVAKINIYKNLLIYPMDNQCFSSFD